MDGVRATVARLPTRPGVYRFRDERGRALYVGRASNLRARVGSYWGDLGSRHHLARMVPRIAAVEAVECGSTHEAAWLERNLLERAKAPWNRIRGGLEVPVYIRLDPHPRVVHTGAPGSDFGPYLGGQKVRTAVSALDRVLPIAYTSSGMTGSARDLARVRGIELDSREELRWRIEAVLGRDPDSGAAVLAELARRRDAAAAELAYELAARIQEEIEAIEWVTAPQRLTRPGTGRRALYGWADSVLVTFEIHNGLVDRWHIRSAARAPAEAARTPQEWVGFVTAAAALAARLRHP